MCVTRVSDLFHRSHSIVPFVSANSVQSSVLIDRKVSENGGSVAEEGDREEEGQAVQEAPKRPQDLRQGISFHHCHCCKAFVF